MAVTRGGLGVGGRRPAPEPAAPNPVGPWIWRTRYKYLPVWCGLLAVVLGLSAYSLSTTQTVVALVFFVLMCGFLIRLRTVRGRKRDLQMAVFLWGGLIAFVTVALVVRFSLLEWGWTAILVMGGVVVFGLFWWFSRTNIQIHEIEKEIEHWPEIAKKLGLEGVRKGPTKKTENGRETWLTWDQGDATIDAVMSKARPLESQLGIPHKQLKFDFKRTDEGFIDSNCIKIMENTGSKIHNTVVPFDKPTMQRITDEMLIGLGEDGNLIKVQWYVDGWGGKHTISGGQTGSGKSSLFDLTFAESAYCQDVVRWGMDRKGGTALIPWASMFDWLALTEESCISMLAAVKEVLEFRADYMGKKGWRTWRPGKNHPVLIVILDEAAEILGASSPGGFNASDYAASIARRARSCGVLLLLAVQHLNLDAVGSTQITKNCARRFCFRVEDMAQQTSIIGGSQNTFDASLIQLPKQAGTFYWTDGGAASPIAGRVRYVDPVKVREIVTEIGDHIADLDPDSVKAAIKGSDKFGADSYAKRQRWLVEDLPPVDDGGRPDDPEDDVYGIPEDHPDSRVTDDPDDEDPTMDDDPEDDDFEPDDDGPELPEHPSTRPLSELFATDDPAELRAAIAAFHAAHGDGPLPDDQAQAMLDAGLDSAGPSGISPAKLQEITGRKRTWVNDRINERYERGEVEPRGAQGPNRVWLRVRPEQKRPDLKVVK
jgi:hypothetical protein